MSFNGCAGVSGARGLEATMLAEEWAEQILVDPDQRKQYLFHLITIVSPSPHCPAYTGKRNLYVRRMNGLGVNPSRRGRRSYNVTIRYMQRFADKVALVVGATSGIGLVTAQHFAREGARVVIAGRNADAGATATASVEGECRFIVADAQDGASIAALMETIANDFGGVDCAFNNAGWEGTAVNTAEIEESDWQRMIDIKLTGTWRCMKLQLEQMLARGGGAIINMVGNFGLVGFPAYASYCAAAHGVMGLTKAAAKEYAGHGIRINAVCPGPVDTALLGRMAGGDEALKHSFGEPLAIGRIAQPDEVAKAVLWLASDEASYVAGAGMVLDGGG